MHLHLFNKNCQERKKRRKKETEKEMTEERKKETEKERKKLSYQFEATSVLKSSTLKILVERPPLFLLKQSRVSNHKISFNGTLLHQINFSSLIIFAPSIHRFSSTIFLNAFRPLKTNCCSF